MSPYVLTQEFFVEVHPSRVIEFSPDATHLCLGRGGLQLDLVELAGCSIVARIAFKSAPTAVLWKYSVPDFLIVGLRDGSFTIVTVDGESEVTFGRTYGLGGPAHVSAIAMSDVHGVLAIATGPIVRIYRFERGTLDFSHVRDIDDGPQGHRVRPIKSLVFSDTGDLFASYSTGITCISPEPTNPSWTGAVYFGSRETSLAAFRAAVCASRVVDNRPLFLRNYGAKGNRTLVVSGGAWLVESTAAGNLIAKSTASKSTVQEITCNRGTRRLWPIAYREFEGKSFLAVSVREKERASVIEVWESGIEYQTAHQQNYRGVKAWFYRVEVKVEWVGYMALSVAACAVVYGLL